MILAQVDRPAPPAVATPAGADSGDHWLDKVWSSLARMRDDAIEFIPNFLTAIILFAIGIAISLLISRAVRLVMRQGGIDALCDKVGVSRILRQAGIKAPLSQIVCKGLFWVLVLMFLMSAAESLGLPQISEPLRGLVAFLPKVITALIIAMAGLVVSDLVRGLVATGAARLGLDYGPGLAGVLRVFILIVVLTIAVGTLGVDTTLIRHAVEILLLAVAIAGALALGLGMKPLAQNIVSGVYARDLYPAGTEVSLGLGETARPPARVVAVGPITTRLEIEGGGYLVVPNSTLVSEVVSASPPEE